MKNEDKYNELFEAQRAEEHSRSIKAMQQDHDFSILELEIPKAITMDSIATMASAMFIPVKNGEKDPLQELIKLKAISKAIDIALERIEEEAKVELLKHGNGANIIGASVKYVNGSRRWDFSHVKAITDLEDKIKSYKELSKNAKSANAVTHDGEIIEPAMEVFTRDAIQVKFI